MKVFFKGVIVGLVSLWALETNAQCFWNDVAGTYDSECNITSVQKGGKEATGAVRERILDKFEQMLKEMNGDCGDGGSFGNCDAEEGGTDGGTSAKIQEKINEIMLVTDKKDAEKEGKEYLDNIHSVRENQHKIKLNAVTRSIALGRRAVALALKSGEDIDEMREEIEKNNDMLNLLKSVAKLQAQHLQKINQITALRSKLLEMNAIDIIITGDIQNMEEDPSKEKDDKNSTKQENAGEQE